MKKEEISINFYKVLYINIQNLKKNYKNLKNLAPECKFLPVIKNDGYGHGLIPVARALSEEGVFGFGLFELEEALLLRKHGFIHPLLLLSGFEKSWLEDMYAFRIIPVITSFEELFALKDFLLKKSGKMEVHLKINTGMNRFGFNLEELPQIIEFLKENPFISPAGLMSHLSASEKDEEFTQDQLKNFNQALSVFEKAGISFKFVHIANSGALIFKRFIGNMVRPGISLFGSYPSFKARNYVKLYPVMTFETEIIKIRKLKKGESLGYGNEFVAQKDMTIGILPVGYGDGYPFSLSNKGFAYLRGKRVPVVGRVCMKCIFIDLTEIENPDPGERVILLGGKEEEKVPIDELASLASTISYEIFCNLGKSIKRVYIE